jgi:outer membrane murein-binding lipoprotein Lpp
MENRRHMGLGALVILAATVVIGCSHQATLTDEMRQQEVQMTNEVGQWSDQIAQWDNDDHEMKAWHASHPVPSTDTPEAKKLRDHEEKMTKHEQDIEQFRRDLDSHRTAVQDESAKPEKDRALAHAALWAEHMKLETTYNMLKGAHEDLAKEHAELVSGSKETAPQTGS